MLFHRVDIIFKVMKTKLKALLQLTRPVNVLIGGLSIFLGGFVTGHIDALWPLMLAAVSGMLITGGANAINDVFDLEIDRINKPQRPLPSGRISLRMARFWALGLFAAGVFVAVWVNTAALLIASLSAGLLYLYSARLKPTAFWGNLTVGFVSGLAFVYGGVAVGRLKIAIVVGGFACLYHIAREIIKDLEDVEGDRDQGGQTLPIRYGFKPAMSIATAAMAAVIAATLLPLCTDWFGRAYYYIVIPGVDLFLVGIAAAMWMKPERARFHLLSTLMKADMLVGLLAVYCGRLL